MNKIANIIYSDELVNHTRVEYINYINFNDDNFKFDHNLPTLYVGWLLLKNLRETDAETILNKELIENEVYWEFSFNEKKSDHISGINLFVRNAPYYYFRNNYKYKNLDPIFSNIESEIDLQNKTPKNPYSIYNHKDEMLYILNENTIYGVNLDMYQYFGIDKIKIIENLKENTPNYYYDNSGSIYQEYYKIYPFFEDLKRYLVVILSKQ